MANATRRMTGARENGRPTGRPTGRPAGRRTGRPAERRTGRRAAALAVVGLLVVGATACSDDKGDEKGDGTANASSTTGAGASRTTNPVPEPVDRPKGPAAEVVKELTEGKGSALTDLQPPALADHGFVEHEFAVKGTATAYEADGELSTDGMWTITPTGTADYVTRVVVRRPEKAADFNGTVVVEWLNVSGGLDANPDWGYLADELLRGGYAWVGVSAQSIGVEGGPVAVSVPVAGDMAGKGLKKLVPERYGSLHHPGDGFSYDMYTQVARAVRASGGSGAGSSGDSGLLGDLEPEVVLAAGESQSAFALTSYANGVQPLTKAFDGFFIHSRGGAGLPFGTPKSSDIAGAIGRQPAQIRTDLDAPVIMVQTESDVAGILGYYAARQDDTDKIRLWEVAGTAHVDRYLLGPIADAIGCALPINAGPLHFAAKAALRGLDHWARTGEAPPKAERLEVSDAGGSPTYVRDANGVAKGGIRTPEVDVPVDVLSGDPSPNPSTICLLMGSTKALSDQQLSALYPTRADYRARYEKAADAAIEAGFVLPEDRDALLADAQPDRIPS
jgi:hypothetical protein